MKKLLALLMALCMLFAFAACGQTEAEKELEQKQDELQDTMEDLTEGETDLEDAMDKLDEYTDAASNAGAVSDMTAKEYVDVFEKTDEWKENVETFKKQGLKADIEARGDSIAYVYQYTIEIPDTAALKSALDETKSALQTAADALRKVLPKTDKVIYEYYDINGDLITSYEL